MALNPLLALFLVILISLFVSTCTETLAIISFSVAIIFMFVMNKSVIKLLFKLKAIIFTSLLIFITNIITHRDFFFSLSETLKFLTLILVSFFFILTVDLFSLSASIGAFLSPILKKYAWIFGSKVMLTLTLLPLILNSAKEMQEARINRNGSFITHPIKNLKEYSVSLMRLLFDKLETFNDALIARSFSSEKSRNSEEWKISDTLIFSSLLVLFILYKVLL